MAKTHKHYSGTHKNKNKNKDRNNSRNSRGKFNHKSKNPTNKRLSNKFSLNNSNRNIHSIDEDDDFIWNNSSLPMGGSDLMIDINEDMKDIDYGKKYVSPKTIEDYYFGRTDLKNNHSLKYAALRRLNRGDDDSGDNYGNDSSEYDDDNNKTNNRNSYRQRKMIFVKAKEPYDPSHELIERLRSKERERIQNKDSSITRSINIIEDTTEEDPYNDDHEVNVPINILNTASDTDNDVLTEELNDANVDSQSNSLSVASSSSSSSPSYPETNSDKDLFFVDETGYPVNAETTIKTVFSDDDYSKVKHLNNTAQHTKSSGNLEFNSSLVIGKVELTVTESNNCNDDHSMIYNNVTVDPISGVVSSIEKKHDKMTGPVLPNKTNNDDVNDNINDIIKNPIQSEENNDTYSHGHSNNNNMEVMINEKIPNVSDKTILKNIKTLKLSEPESEVSIQSNDEEDPEFGFLEEDYIINTSEVRVSNIRLGFNENSYYVESYKLFGDYDARWIDQELFIDFILNDIGLPEHRLNSYLKYIKDSLIPKEETPEPEYSDIFTDEESEEEEEEEENNFETNENGIPDNMMEGLDDLVSYSLKYNDTRNQEFETHALQVIGKGKKKQFLINEDMQLDGETIETLQNKLQKRTLQKAKKRRTKEDFICEENKNSKDLFKKYPFGLHVQNIKDEFELFLSYSSDSFSFPPLDPHGNKTVAKFANCYNMKTKKSGRGNKQHIIIQKTKKTRWGTPNYNLISQLLKQRPIFMRTDVSRISEAQVGGRVIRERSNTTRAKFYVKEGEVVGEDAPEIGKENIGRRLLEKLGWSSGEGLGAHGNKGISEPVLAIVKKSKTGLGHRSASSENSNNETVKSHKHHHHHKRRRRHVNSSY